MKKFSKEREVQKKRDFRIWIVAGVMMTLVVICVCCAWAQMKKYERGVLDVYAVQQDGYVQLVLDQINLQEDRDSEEIVHNILETLDASSNHYWTLSDAGSLVFVKDVLETNRYKGFTQESYYTSGSAGEFIKSLQEDRVTHREITVKDQDFVASGVSFSYNGKSYAMCLLTSTDAILDQNEYLSAKITLELLVLIALAVVVCGGFILALMTERRQKECQQIKGEKQVLFEKVEKMNHLRMKELLFHPRYSAFYPGALPELLERMEKKNIWPLEMVLVKCEKGEQRDEFMSLSQIYLGKKTLRVILDDAHVMLLFMREESKSQEEMKKFIESLKGEYIKSRRWEEPPEESLKKEFVSFWNGGEEDGK